MSVPYRCFEPLRMDGRSYPGLMCRWFGCMWEFSEHCCWIRAECRRCGRVGVQFRHRTQCPKSFTVRLRAVDLMTPELEKVIESIPRMWDEAVATVHGKEDAVT